MKKFLFRLLTLAVIVPALASCMGQLEDNLSQAKKHTVYFSTVVDGQATRTGLTIADGIVTPDWRETNPKDIHVFEINGSNAHLGEASAIDPYDDNLGAHFKAEIEEEITIIVTPPDTPTGDGAKVLRQGSNTYGAVVAKMRTENNAPVFYIPAVQTPDAELLKDPGAEFLVGYSRDGYDALTIDEEGTIVDLYFDRVAALSRIGFSEFQGTNEKVMSVKINSATSMTGSVPAAAISFGNPNSVTFTPDEGAGVLTLNYGETGAELPAEGAFYAYFVSMPGTFSITSIEVETDQYRYTKTFDGGKSLTFDLQKLANLSMDLSTAVAEEISSNVWYKASMLEVGYDYIIVSAGYALKNNGNGNTVAATEVTISENNTIELDDTEGLVWTVANADESLLANGKYTLKNGTEYLYRHGGSSTSTLEAATEPATPKYGVWDYEDGYFFNISTSSGTSTYYAYYSSGWKITTTKTSAMIFTNRAPQELSFDGPGPFEYNLDDPTVDFQEPILSEHYGEVTYTSSDENKATVAADGNVTFIKAGQVTITATAAGDATHQAASASYVINITSSQVLVYNKVTSVSDLEEGAQYLLVFEGIAGDTDGDGDPKVFSPVLNSAGSQFEKATSSALAVTIDNSSITSSDFEDCHFTLESGYYLKADKVERYIYPYKESSSSTRGALFAESTASHSLSITFGNNGIAQILYDGYYLIWSTSSHYFSSNTSVSGSSSTGICLYKLYDNRQPWEMSYSATAATYDLYTQAWTPGTPSLSSNATTTVTYYSSDESVATVNENGVVTPIKKGTTTISAAAAADATHKRTVASYELTVEDSSPAKVYTRVESTADLDIDARYLIVYESGSKVFKPVLASSTSTTFTASADNVLSATISSNTITSNDFEDCELTLEDGYYFYVESVDKYLYPSASGIGAENPKDTGHSFSISISNGTASISRTSNNSTYRLIYYTSRNYFRSRNADANVALYKLEDDRPAWTMSYSTAEATYDLYTQAWTPGTPSLSSNATTTVTYTSSNVNVATVNESGVVTPIKKGTATITATAPADATHKKTVASFELTVEDSTPVTMVTVNLKKATSVSAGKQYVLVSNGKALVRNEGDAEVYDFNSSDLTVSVPSNLRDNLEWTLQSSSNLFKNGDYYFGIVMDQSGSTSYIYTAELSTTTSNIGGDSNKSMPNLTIDTSGDYIYYSGNSSAYFIYYDASADWTTYKITKANSYTHSYKTALYVVDDGSGDDPEPPTPTTVSYSKVDAVTSGATYLIVSHTDAYALVGNGDTANNNTNYISVTPNAGVISGPTSDFENCEAIITEESSGAYSIYFTKLGQYLYYSSSQSGLTYGTTHNSSNDFSLSTVASGDNAGSFLFTKSSRYLYYNGTFFKIGGSGSDIGVHLYKKVDP